MVSRNVPQTVHWVQAARPLAQINIAGPLVLGQAAAWHAHQRLELGWLVGSLLWGVLDHLCIVFGNDYADREADSERRTWISGGSGVIPEGKIEAQAIRRAAQGAVIALLGWSAVLAGLGRQWTPVYAFIAIALLWLYSYPPARLSYRGGGELLQGLGLGVGLPSLGYYLQTGSFLAPVWILVPALIAGTSANVLTALPDIDDDRVARKRTWPVRVGLAAARRSSSLGVIIAAASASLWTPELPLLARALVCALPLVAVFVASRQQDSFSAAWWASGAIQALWITWIVALLTTVQL